MVDAGSFAPVPADLIARAPKVLLHDHLDGGLRPSTVIELAADSGYSELPATQPEALASWFADAAYSGSLERYLETFKHTVGVTQTQAALRRVARECAIDLAADGVVYAEVRYAPELHTQLGLTLPSIVEAVLAGFAEGEREAAKLGQSIRVGVLLTAMRTATHSREIAELSVAFRDRGVVGFDIAGAEAGFPPTRHLDAFEYLRRENAHFTIHAGEAFGLPSIWEAIQWCGADRLGHGVRIVDDITIEADGEVTLGRLAAYVRDRRIPLEMCPSSNVQTAAAPSIAEHPIGLLRRLGFRVTVNTDNRLMSGTSMTHEMQLLCDAFHYGLDDLQWFTVNAMKSAFLPFDERLQIINEQIKPAYAELRAVLADRLINGQSSLTGPLGATQS
ncbi:MAG: adenosine deaminase [Actinomycetota bacterium]|nr:adenosine deaminase [Actinomycetota bacterium]MDP2289204.1 adenosine deaminase [Actinomycetota bacterium]